MTNQPLSPPPGAAAAAELSLQEEHILPFIQKIEQIDRILVEPVWTLVQEVGRALDENQVCPRPRFGLTRRLGGDSSASPSALTTAATFSTVQRLWRLRRRFPQLEKSLERLQKKSQKLRQELRHGARRSSPEPEPLTVSTMLARPFCKPACTVEEEYRDPLIASQVLWVLLHAGERYVHTRSGFLAFFYDACALISKQGESGGVVLGSGPPNAWVTARCWLPLKTLARICHQRARLFEEIAKWLEKLNDTAAGERLQVPEKLSIDLDALSAKLFTLAELAVTREGFRDCAQKIERLALEPIGPDTTRKILHHLTTLLEQTAQATKAIVAELGPLFREGGELSGQPPTGAQKQACEVCKLAFEEFKETETAFRHQVERTEWGACERLPEEGLRPELVSALARLAKSNRRVGESISTVLSDTAGWAENQIHRQVAYASAGDDTRLDPAQLVGSLAVAVWDGRFDSPLAFEDAVSQLLRTQRLDGSWPPSRSIYGEDRLLASPPAADVTWILAELATRFAGITVADDALCRWVDWAERTSKAVQVPDPAQTGDEPRTRVVRGWTSGQDPGEHVDLLTTASTVNALLAVRGLMEHRLWEFCKRRFTVLDAGKSLGEIDAVDLGLRHEYRLHRRLAKMARETDGDEFEDAEYSLILHGPPGSSKTAVSEALATEMWRSIRTRSRRTPRLIRITPADFTRLGESRIDSEARLIFELLSHVRGVTILFDEIDDLLRKRSASPQQLHFLDLVVPAMLNRLQDLRDTCSRQEICFLLATNFVEKIEPALIRKGRIDDAIAVVYPDHQSRRCIVARHVDKLREKFNESQDECYKVGVTLLRDRAEAVASRLSGKPWKTIDEVLKKFRKRLPQTSTLGEADLDSCIEDVGGQPVDPYLPRQQGILDSPELRRELVLHHMAACSDRKELFARVKATAPGVPMRDLVKRLWERRVPRTSTP